MVAEVWKRRWWYGAVTDEVGERLGGLDAGFSEHKGHVVPAGVCVGQYVGGLKGGVSEGRKTRWWGKKEGGNERAGFDQIEPPFLLHVG